MLEKKQRTGLRRRRVRPIEVRALSLIGRRQRSAGIMGYPRYCGREVRHHPSFSLYWWSENSHAR